MFRPLCMGMVALLFEYLNIMVDPRFFESIGPKTLVQILQAIRFSGGAASGRHKNVTIKDAGELHRASSDQICMAAHKSYADKLKTTRAGAVFVTEQMADRVPPDCVALVCTDPHLAFVDFLDYMFPYEKRLQAAQPSIAHLGDPVLEEGVQVAANAVVGSGAEIGKGTIVGPNTVIGPGVTIGRNCVIGANVTIECTLIGDEVIIGHGARIGTDGFGWLDHGKTNRKIPQLGRTILQTRAEIGPNAIVERGTLGDTVIGEGSKIGAMAEIGHNSSIGRNCLLAPVVGLAGSTIIEDGVLMGPNSASSGHLTVGVGSVLIARTAVTKSWPAGSLLAGAPAQKIKDFWRELAVLRRLAKGDKT